MLGFLTPDPFDLAFEGICKKRTLQGFYKVLTGLRSQTSDSPELKGLGFKGLRFRLQGFMAKVYRVEEFLVIPESQKSSS